MPEITNLSRAPRTINVVAGKDNDGKPISGQVVLMPGETQNIEVFDKEHPVYVGMINEGDLAVDADERRKAEAAMAVAANGSAIEMEVQRRVYERLDVERGLSGSALSDVQAKLATTEAQLNDVKVQAEAARVAGMARIADLQSALDTKGVQHAAAIAEMQKAHDEQIAALTAPASKK